MGIIETLQLGTYYCIYILATYLITLKGKFMFLDHLLYHRKSRNKWVFHNSEVSSPGSCFLPCVHLLVASLLSPPQYVFAQTPDSALHSANTFNATCAFPTIYFSLGPEISVPLKPAVIPTTLFSNNCLKRSPFFLL